MREPRRGDLARTLAGKYAIVWEVYDDEADGLVTAALVCDGLGCWYHAPREELTFLPAGPGPDADIPAGFAGLVEAFRGPARVPARPDPGANADA